MTHARRLCASLAALLVAACAEGPPTGIPADDLDPPPSLSLRVPSIGSDLLVAAGADAPAVTDAPAGVETADEEPPPVGPDPDSGSDADISEYLDAVGAIYDEYTKVGFGSGYAFSYAENKYQGNKGTVQTTVSVSRGDYPLGTQTALTEKYDVFLLDVGWVHFISATARFYTDLTCGLTVRGVSQHSAWWEWFLGGSATSWGKATKTSDAPGVSQPDCPTVPTGSGGSSTPTSGFYCYFWVTYDLETGEIYDMTLLYCVGY